jgi:hypothetical protein
MMEKPKMERNKREEQQQQANQPVQALRGSPPWPSMNGGLLLVVQLAVMQVTSKQLHMHIDSK